MNSNKYRNIPISKQDSRNSIVNDRSPHQHIPRLNGTHNYYDRQNSNNSNKYKNSHANNTYNDADVIYPGEETLFDGESDTVSMLNEDQVEHFANSDMSNDSHNDDNDDDDSENDEDNLVHDRVNTNSHDRSSSSNSSNYKNKSINVAKRKG